MIVFVVVAIIVVIIADVLFVVVVVLNVYVVVQATSKVDLIVLSMEVQFPGSGGVLVVVVNSNNLVKPNSVELSRGCIEVEFGL